MWRWQTLSIRMILEIRVSIPNIHSLVEKYLNNESVLWLWRAWDKGINGYLSPACQNCTAEARRTFFRCNFQRENSLWWEKHAYTLSITNIRIKRKFFSYEKNTFRGFFQDVQTMKTMRIWWITNKKKKVKNSTFHNFREGKTIIISLTIY